MSTMVQYHYQESSALHPLLRQSTQFTVSKPASPSYILTHILIYVLVSLLMIFKPVFCAFLFCYTNDQLLARPLSFNHINTTA